jgi:hypothetical protein
MPKYIARRDTLLAHENRVVKAGEEFTTTFPKVKNHEGKEVEITLADNIELVDEKAAAKSKPKAKDAEGDTGGDLA